MEMFYPTLNAGATSSRQVQVTFKSLMIPVFKL